VFARVVKGGSVEAGLPIKVVDEVSRETIQAAVLTVSDRCAAGQAQDTAGPAIVTLLEQQMKAHIAWTGTVPDEREVISTTLKDLADRSLDLILTTGGTGCTPRDVTPEATRAVIEREVPGLSEAMRATSACVTPHAWLQRGTSGLLASTLIINLPGSEKAAEENLRAILPALLHAIQQARGNATHPETDTRGDSG
jgi:molybdenum cofactor synthesis domain-containing protein